jgi:hypothetical protein
MSLPIIEQAKIQAQVLVPLVLCSWRWESSGQTPLFGGPWETCIAVTAKNFGGPRAKRTLARPWRLRLQPSRAGMRSIIKCANNHKMSSQLTSRDAGMPSSTRSWESRSWGSCWCAARTFSWPKVLVLTSRSRARRFSCKARVIAIFATADRAIWIERPHTRFFAMRLVAKKLGSATCSAGVGLAGAGPAEEHWLGV